MRQSDRDAEAAFSAGAAANRLNIGRVEALQIRSALECSLSIARGRLRRKKLGFQERAHAQSLIDDLVKALAIFEREGC